MLKRYLLPALVVVVLAVPAQAQRKDRPGAVSSIKSNPQFLALFRPAVEGPAKSVLRVQVDGKDAALGTIVAENGYVLTKASEIKEGKVTVKTRDGRDLDAKLTATSEAFDLAVLKVDGAGLTPITWASTKDAPVGNWVAVPGLGADPAAVGVVSTTPRSTPPPYGPPRVPTEESGFLGVQLDPEAAGAVVFRVTPESAADRAGIQFRDQILQIDAHEIANQESLINTLLGYKAGEKVKVLLEREGKRMELTVTLGKRTPDQLPPKGKGGNRGDMQNAMGSALSERRTGIPRFFQTDAVVKPSDCGGPLVDLDGRAVGLMIARAGRTESHAIPAETVKGLLPVLLAAGPAAKPTEKVTAVREALEQISAEAPPEAVAEAKRLLRAAEAEEKWWKEHPIEPGPAPRPVGK